MEQKQDSAFLVTGGQGFIGRAVVEILRNSGHTVVSIDAVATHSVSDRNAGNHEFPCDISDAVGLRQVFETHAISGIVHLAAILPTMAQREPLRATEVNVEGSLHLLELAKRLGVRRFVFGSSLSVYGTCSVDLVVSEQDRAAPEDLYGAAKVYVEQLGQAYQRIGGAEFVSLRIGRVVGPGAQSTTSPWRSQIFECLAARTPVEITLPYVGSERILLVQVNDVAQMLVNLLVSDRLKHSIYNAACESVSVEDLKREVESLNPNIQVQLGKTQAVGNPRRLDWSRYQQEFGFIPGPIFKELALAAQKTKSDRLSS